MSGLTEILREEDITKVALESPGALKYESTGVTEYPILEFDNEAI